MKHSLKKSIVSYLLVAALLSAILVGCQPRPAEVNATQGLMLHADAVETLNTLQKLADNFYTLEYKADYALDDMLAQGAADSYTLGDCVSRQVLGGLPFHFPIPALGCSAFTAITPDGDYIQGRNLDIADAQNTLVRTQPENGYASLSVASGLLLGYSYYMPDSLVGRQFMLAAPYYPVDGINEKGLSVAILLLYAAPPVSQNTGKVPITTTMAVRMLLDKAATVEEAIALMAEYDMYSIANSNIHFQLADANGESAVIEYVNGKMQVLLPEEYGRVVTNFFLSTDVQEDYRDGEDRLISLQAALDANKGTVTAKKAFEMLDAVKAVHDYDELSGIDYNTSYSIVFNNSKRCLDICVNMDYDTMYRFDVDGTF